MTEYRKNAEETDPLLECPLCQRTWRKSEMLSQGVCPGCHQVDDGIVEEVAQESEAETK